MNAPLIEPTTFLPLTPAMRRRLEATIESLVALLDALDGDPDLEAAPDDEPSLGWPESHCGRGVLRSVNSDDRESDDELDEDNGDFEPGGDDEPNLGRLETLHQGGGTYMGLDE